MGSTPLTEGTPCARKSQGPRSKLKRQLKEEKLEQTKMATVVDEERVPQGESRQIKRMPKTKDLAPEQPAYAGRTMRIHRAQSRRSRSEEKCEEVHRQPVLVKGTPRMKNRDSRTADHQAPEGVDAASKHRWQCTKSPSMTPSAKEQAAAIATKTSSFKKEHLKEV